MAAVVYNRPANVEGVYGDVARVRYQDNGTLGYVPADAVQGPDEGGDGDDE